MDWIINGFISIGILVAAWKLLAWQAVARNRGRMDFEHHIKSLLVVNENGGSLHVKHRGSDVVIDLFRAEGEGDEALLVVRVPRAPWSEQHGRELYGVFESNLLDVRIVQEPGSKTLVEARIPVKNIWEDWCGAESARALHLALDALGVPRGAKFDLSLLGAPSQRWRTRKEQLRETGHF
jgi:hypothetical protein